MSQTVKSKHKKIAKLESYLEQIKDPVLALQYALETRRFEIELYWRRAAYFWTLIAAAFAAFLALMSADMIIAELVFVVACIGLLLSLAWYLANRGSKYWQENWEGHVDALERGVVGDLFKVTIDRDKFKFISLSKGFPYSLSRINQIISLYITIVWLLLIIWRVWESWERFSALEAVIALITAGFCGWLLTAISSVQVAGRIVSFRSTRLDDSDSDSSVSE